MPAFLPDEDHAWLLSFALPIVAHLPRASFRANDSTRQDAQTTLPRAKTTLQICGLYLLRNVSPGPRSPARRRPRPQVHRHRCASALPRSRTPGAVAPRQTFALTLVHTATRVSKALAIRPFDVDLEAVSIRTRSLKRRDEHWREVPVPPELLRALKLVHPLRSTPTTSRRQAPLVSVDRPPESRQDHGRCRRRGSPSVPEGTTAWFLHCGRRHRRADDDDRGRPGPRQPADHRDLHHRRGSRGAGFSGSDVGSEGGFGRIRRLKASGEGP